MPLKLTNIRTYIYRYVLYKLFHYQINWCEYNLRCYSEEKRFISMLHLKEIFAVHERECLFVSKLELFPLS